MLTTQKNRFSHLLENLLYIAEIKNSSLAKALQYDVSYISKWINGRKLPAERNRKKILSCISHAIVSQCSAAGLRDLYDNYRVSTPTALEKVIYDNLEAEYNYVIDTKQTYGTTVPPETTFQPELTPSQYIMKMHHPVLRRVSNLHIMAQIDLLSLMHEHRLQIVQNNLRYDEYRDYPDVHFSLMIDLAESKINYDYDPIFLIKMIADMVRIDFHLYAGAQASGRMIFTVKDDFMISGMLADTNRCICITISSDTDNCNPVYTSIQDCCTQEMLLFEKTTMSDMIVYKDYERSILALNQHWILGHVTEHFLPDDLFEELLEQTKQYADIRKNMKTIRYLHKLTKRMLEQTPVDILIYSNALFNFAIDNTLDFFDHAIHLTIDQKKRFMQHLLKLNMEKENLSFKLVYETSGTDFDNDFTQCLFLSDSIAYARLDTKNGNNNLVIFHQSDMKQLLHNFFEHFWNDSSLTDDRENVQNYIKEILHRVNIIRDLKNN